MDASTATSINVGAGFANAHRSASSRSSARETARAAQPKPAARSVKPMPGRSTPGGLSTRHHAPQRLERAVPLVVEDHERDRQVVLPGRPQRLDRVEARTVAEQADHPARRVAEGDADRGRQAEAESSAGAAVEAAAACGSGGGRASRCGGTAPPPRSTASGGINRGDGVHHEGGRDRLARRRHRPSVPVPPRPGYAAPGRGGRAPCGRRPATS